VPDTVNGRFEMVVLPAVLLLRRLESEPASLRRLGQALFERFCQDMDGSLREMGVGDLAVPAKMRKIGEAFYGSQAAYVAALAAGDREPLVAALARNVFGARPGAQLGAIRLATYARAVADELPPIRMARPSGGESSTFPTRNGSWSPARTAIRAGLQHGKSCRTKAGGFLERSCERA